MPVDQGSQPVELTSQPGEPTRDSSEPTSATVDWSVRRSDRVAAKAAERRKRLGLWIAVGLLAAIAVAVGADAALSVGRIYHGVTIAGIDVGGNKPAAAEDVLKRELPKKTNKAVVVTHADKTWSVASTDIGLDFDYRSTIDEAMEIGRGGILSSVEERLEARLRGVEMSATPVADEVLSKAVFATIASGTDVKPVDASVKVSGVTAEVVPGKDGIALDHEAATSMVLSAFLSKNHTVTAPIVVDPVTITDAEAADAAAQAEKMLQDPVKVTYQDQSWEFTPKELGSWIGFRRSGETTGVASNAPTATVTLEPYVDSEKATKAVLGRVGAGVGRKAKNARFKTSNGQITIIPSEDGIGPDVDALAIGLTEKLTSDSGDRTVELVTTRTEPEITTEEARKMGVTERISTYTTTFSSGNRPRVNNIHQLGDSLDGTLIAPGKTFSFNGVVGERTAAKGYQEAGAIVNGELVPQLGGGICQVNTTLFNTIFESGLPVIERRNHSQYISHYPKGRDATVSWGGPDFKFKNDTPNWVLISVSYTASSITVALYGTDPGYEVDSLVGDWTNITAPPVTEEKDPTLPVGTKVIKQRGQSGRTITVKRTVTKDGKVVRTDDFVSRYKPEAQIVRVGTKPVAAPTPAPEAVTP